MVECDGESVRALGMSVRFVKEYSLFVQAIVQPSLILFIRFILGSKSNLLFVYLDLFCTCFVLGFVLVE